MKVPADCAYGDVRATSWNFDEAVSKVEEALKTEGFGVLCLTDIRAKLKEKLGIDFPRYVILGACNPPLARQALEQDVNLGLLLPCNAIVYEQDSQVLVGAVDAAKMLSVTDRPEMAGLANQVNEKLRRALDSVAPRASD
ncbi:MAG: DUF302 domain-containing protein [Candidatus Acidiferrum sp.]